MRVLAAVDGSASAVRACRIAARMLPAGSEIQLLVVLSFELDPYTLLGEEVPETEDMVERVTEAVEAAAGEARDVLAAAGFEVTVTHRFGNPADEILAEAEATAPALIVLGRRGLGAPKRWLLGSVSDRVMHHAQAPVLVVS